MNKMMLIPLGFMLILTMFMAIYTGNMDSGTGTTDDYGNSSGIDTSEGSGYVDIPSGGSHTFNIWSTEGVILILSVAIAVGIIAGIKVIGSGLSVFSQSLIFNGILFGGLWACLTIISSEFLFIGVITEMLWIFLTVTYIIGMGIHLNGNASGD
jgi:hypothetical protein